jgi:hypothetical protein
LTVEQQKTLALYWTNDVQLEIGANGVACVIPLEPIANIEDRAQQAIMSHVDSYRNKPLTPSLKAKDKK